MTATVHPVPDDFQARIDARELAELNARALNDPDAFWIDQARRLTWNRTPAKAGDWSFHEAADGTWYRDPDDDPAETSEQLHAVIAEAAAALAEARRLLNAATSAARLRALAQHDEESQR